MKMRRMRRKNRFNKGYNIIVPEKEIGMELGLRILAPHEVYRETDSLDEVCFLLLCGEIKLNCGNGQRAYEWFARRKDIFTENPSALLLPKIQHFKIEAYDRGAELIEVRIKNSYNKKLKPIIVRPKEVREEWRGNKDIGNQRLVKTVFDLRNAPKSNIVIGEVITPSGMWAGYPPHFHPQPEIYFYRFKPEQGYGICQLGEKAFKVYSDDAVLINPNITHPQACGPGYTMWYLWVIKHLPENPYTGFEFEKDHKWVLKLEKGGR